MLSTRTKRPPARDCRECWRYEHWKNNSIVKPSQTYRLRRFFVAVYHSCCPYSRISQGKECVQGKPLSGFPCTFNQRPPTAALIFAPQKSEPPWVASNINICFSFNNYNQFRICLYRYCCKSSRPYWDSFFIPLSFSVSTFLGTIRYSTSL